MDLEQKDTIFILAHRRHFSLGYFPLDSKAPASFSMEYTSKKTFYRLYPQEEPESTMAAVFTCLMSYRHYMMKERLDKAPSFLFTKPGLGKKKIKERRRDLKKKSGEKKENWLKKKTTIM